MKNDVGDLDAVLERIRSLVKTENVRVTQHAQQEMVEENIKLTEAFESIDIAQIPESYLKHRRGACWFHEG